MRRLRHPNLLPMFCSFARGHSTAAPAPSPQISQAPAAHAAQLARAASSRRSSADSTACESAQLAGSVQSSTGLESLPESGASEPVQTAHDSHEQLNGVHSQGTEAGNADAAMCLVLPYVSGGSLEDILHAHFRGGMVRICTSNFVRAHVPFILAGMLGCTMQIAEGFTSSAKHQACR